MTVDEILEAAKAATAAGLAVVPPRTDGSKAPAGRWSDYQTRKPTRDELNRWYGNGTAAGLGLVCGTVSGGLELLEFESAAITGGLWDQYQQAADDTGAGDLLERVRAGYSEETPSGGLHLLYRVDGEPLGNVKLAQDTDGRVLIETRGEGGYVIVAPTNGKVHPSGKPWRLIAGGFDTLATITATERDQLHDLARRFTAPPPVRHPDPGPRISVAPDWPRPGDEFDTRHSCAQVLEAAGFVWHSNDTDSRRGGTATHYTRPGKDPRDGSSATVWADGRCTIWSTSVPTPAEIDDRRRLTPWQLHTHLHHAGDFTAAAAEWRRRNPSPPERPRLDTPPTEPAPLHVPPPPMVIEPDDLAAIAAAGLDPIEPDLWWRRDGRGLLYRGRLNVFFGAPESGKTWCAIAAAAEQVTNAARRGDQRVAVVFLDWEDDARTYLTRMKAAGCDLQAVITHTRHYTLTQAASELPGTLEGLNTADLVVVDTTNSAMVYGNLDPLDNRDALEFVNVIRRLRDHSTQAAWQLLDHEPIATGTGRRQAIGAQSKFGAVDGAQYRVKAIEQPRPGQRGAIGLYVTKDRAGGVREHAATPDEHGIQHAATLTLEPIAASPGRFTWELREPQESERENKIRDDVIDQLRQHNRMTKNQLRDAVTGRGELVLEVIERLANEGRLDTEPRKGGGTWYTLAATVRSRATPVPDPGNDSLPDPFPITGTPT